MFALIVIAICGSSQADQKREKSSMRMKINEEAVSVEWVDNASVKALQERLPITVKMSMYGGFEQVGSLGQSLPRNDKRITTNAGDIMLYSGNQIVIFYGSNTWAYTKLGRITNKTPSQLAEILSQSDATITIY